MGVNSPSFQEGWGGGPSPRGPSLPLRTVEEKPFKGYGKQVVIANSGRVGTQSLFGPSILVHYLLFQFLTQFLSCPQLINWVLILMKPSTDR